MNRTRHFFIDDSLSAFAPQGEAVGNLNGYEFSVEIESACLKHINPKGWGIHTPSILNNW